MSTLRAVSACVENATIRRLLQYQVVLAITAAIEAINVVLVASLVSYLLTGEMNIALSQAAEILNRLGLISDPTRLTVEFVIYVALANILSAILGIVNIFVLSHLAADAGRRLANRILKVFLNATSNGLLSIGPSTVTKLLTLEANRVTDYIFQNFAQVNARIYTALVIGGLLIYTSASAFFISVALFLLTYLILMLIVRRRLGTFGTSISQINAKRLKLLEEMTTGYKEIKSLSAEGYFDSSLSREHANYARLYRNLNLIYNTPRFVIELIIFICLMALTAYSITASPKDATDNMSEFLPIFGLAALKLLPIFQQIYSGYAQARAHSPAAKVISDFFAQFSLSSEKSETLLEKSPLPLNRFNEKLNSIAFEALNFSYNGQGDGFSFSFHLKKEAINFIVGPSGAGKTTLLEILSDLRAVDSGQLVIGNESFDLAKTSLRTACSYSAQRPFVVEGTVEENLTLGRIVTQEAVTQAVDAAHLRDFLKTLPDELNTMIGAGIRELSVGQLQRLGLARHLAAGRHILILDEPTSNLDQKTGDAVFASLREIAKEVFVVCVTHDTDRITPDDHVIRISAGKTKLDD